MPDLQTVSDDDSVRDPDDVNHEDVDDEFINARSEAMLARDTEEVILFDSGATSHMSCHRDRFLTYAPIASPRAIRTADQHTFKAIGRGDMRVTLPDGKGGFNSVTLRDVLYAPSMGVTLVSIHRIALTGATVVFTSNKCRVVREDGDVCAVIPAADGLYRLRTPRTEFAATAHERKRDREMTAEEVHRVPPDVVAVLHYE